MVKAKMVVMVTGQLHWLWVGERVFVRVCQTTIDILECYDHNSIKGPLQRNKKALKWYWKVNLGTCLRNVQEPPANTAEISLALEISRTCYFIISGVKYNITMTLTFIHCSASHRPAGPPQGGINTEKQSQAADQATVTATHSGLWNSFQHRWRMKNCPDIYSTRCATAESTNSRREPQDSVEIFAIIKLSPLI